MLQRTLHAHPHRTNWKTTLVKPLLHQGKTAMNQIKTGFWNKLKSYKDSAMTWAQTRVPKMASSFAQQWVGKQLGNSIGNLVQTGIKSLNKKIISPYIDDKAVNKTKKISKQIERLQRMLQISKRRQQKQFPKQQKNRISKYQQDNQSFNLTSLFQAEGKSQTVPSNTIDYNRQSFI